MNGVVIAWDEATPAGSESIGNGDNRIRSMKTDLRTALDDEHIFPSSGGTAGLHRIGSARAYWGTQSRVSASTTSENAAPGRMMITSDTSRLFGVSSDGTMLLGPGPLGLSFTSWAGITYPARKYMAIEAGTVSPDGGNGERMYVAFPNSGFSEPPFVFVSQMPFSAQTGEDRAAGGHITRLHNVTVSDFSCVNYDVSNATVGQPGVYWMAIGSRAL